MKKYIILEVIIRSVMFRRISYVFVLFFLCVPAISYADSVLLQCSVTPSASPFVEAPKEIVLTNNLRRRTALIQVAEGEVIYFQGRVVDEHCVPVSGAAVTIWHADSKGYYVGDEDEADWDQYFSGSGVAVTDNLGRYYFISVSPGSVDGGAPTIHLRVEHSDFELFETDVFLDDKLPVDLADMPYLDFTVDTLNALTAFSEPIDRLKDVGQKYSFPVTLSEKSLLRRF